MKHVYKITAYPSGEVLDDDATPTPFMLCDWPGRIGKAVRREGLWYATDYPGFVVEAGETVLKIRIREAYVRG